MYVETAEEKTTRRNRLLATIQEALADWLDCFDEPPELNLCFTVDGFDMLRLNGIALCSASQLTQPLDAMFDNDVFVFSTITGQLIEICIEWPFNAKPYISLISKRENIYVHQ